jgi:hypothetical protein
LHAVLTALGAADLVAIEAGASPNLSARLTGPDGREFALG